MREDWLLGIDPGRTGAALLLSPAKQPTVLWTWRPRTRGGVRVYEVCIVQHVPGEDVPRQRRETVESLHDLGVLMRDGTRRVTGAKRWRLAAEAPHISRLNPRTGLSLAVTTGKITGPMEPNTGGEQLVQPAEWRAELLQLPPRTPRDRCKRISLREMPRRLPLLAPMLEAVSRLHGVKRSKLDHVTDAAGVAEYGYLYDADHTDEDDPDDDDK